MQKSLTFGRLTVVALFAVAALIAGISTAFAAAPNWDTTGNYEVAFTCSVGCSGTYNHDLTLSQDGSGNLTGSGGNPVGAHVYNWILTSGAVDADAINFTANYTSTPDAVTPQTTMNVVGTIVGGSMSGTWTDNYQGAARSGTWATVDGTAGPIVPPSSTVVVTGNTSAGENQPGWLFNRDTSTETPFSFQVGNASIGTGSLFVPAITNTVDGNSDKFVGELFLLDPLSGINSISYDFKIASTGAMADKDHFYMSVYANFGESAPTKFYDCRYSVVPTIGVVDGYTTVTFDPTLSYPVVTRGDSPHPCPASPSGMNALDVGSPTLRMVALNVGDTSGSDTGISGYLDKVVVNTDSDITTYDFEPAAAPSPLVTVTINKFIDGAMATTGSANSSAFPMTATWNAANIGAGSGPYDLDADGFNGDPTPYQAITAQMTSGADYATQEVVGGSVVGATCADGKPYALAGYSSGDSFAAAAAAATSTTAPALTNITSNKYIIVRNVTCAPPAPVVTPENACSLGLAPQGYTLQQGTTKNDVVTLANNTMFMGNGGNDVVKGGNGNFIICTGASNDVITVGNGTSVIDAGAGNNVIKTGNGDQRVTTAGGNDVITTGSGNDTIDAGDGNNTVKTNGGTDMIVAGTGNDVINGGAGQDTCQAGAGNNVKTACEL